MKVLFINDSTSSSNWGDRAAAISLQEMIRRRGGRIIFSVSEQSIWDSQFAPPAADEADQSEPPDRVRDLARHWLPPAVLEARRWVLARRPSGGQDQHDLIPASWEDFGPAATRVLRQQEHGWPQLLGAMDEADVAIIHGASLHGRLSFPRTLMFLSYLCATHFGTPVVIANHTADLQDSVLRRMAERVYPLFDDVVFRDPLSAERLAHLCAGRFGGDTAFLFAPAERAAWAAVAGRLSYLDVWPDVAAFDPGRPYVCIGGSSIFHSCRDWRSLMESYGALIDRLRSVYEGTIVLTASAELDEPLFRTLARSLHLPLIGVRTPVQQAVDLVGNADAYIGGRWHPSIFALRGGTPLVALSSETFKMRALTSSPGASPTTFDALDPGRDAGRGHGPTTWLS